jgi:hypothetical protein
MQAVSISGERRKAPDLAFPAAFLVHPIRAATLGLRFDMGMAADITAGRLFRLARSGRLIFLMRGLICRAYFS